MPKSVILFTFILFAGLLLTAFIPKTGNPKTVIFLGDSISNRGLRPDGYISVLKQELEKKGKADKYILIGAGHEGNTVLNLQTRLERDVLSKNPDIVFIYIGINDVWKVINNPPTNTPLDKYEAGLQELITKTKATGAKVILCTPSVIGEKHDGTNPQDALLEQYAAISRKVAKENKAKLCDLRKAFIKHLKQNNLENKEKDILTIDKVHLNAAGNKLVANQMLKFLK